MLGTPARAFLSLAAAALAFAAASPAGAAVHPAQASPIGPNQFFEGLISNHPPGQAIIFMSITSCTPGAKTGHPVSGQSVEVKQTPSAGTTDTGFTGSKGTGIGMTVGPVTSTKVVLKFAAYGVAKNLPATLVLPCSGSGKADFIPAPPSSTAKTAVLPVTFEVQP